MDIRGIDHLSPDDLAEQLRRGARFVHFEYCVSLIAVTWRRPTDIILLAPGRRGVFASWPYLLLTLLLGWWGLPWGILLTPAVLYTNLCGGRDVTDEVWAFLTAAARPANPPAQQGP